jgi:hypothetical protein
MTRLRQHLHERAHRKGLHGHDHIAKQRLTALILIYTALGRVAAWTVLTILYLVGVAFAVTLFKSVAFVALISMAQLTAGDAHHDIEATRKEVSFDTAQIEEDIARLAKLRPSKKADALAAEIRARVCGK